MRLLPVACVVLGLAAPAVAAGASGPPKVDLSVAFILPSGTTWAERKTEAILGSETTVDVHQKSRTITLKITVRVASQPGCYAVELSVNDRDIDTTGHFTRTEWQTRGQPCGGFAVTLGPKEETRVRLAVQPAGAPPPAAR